MNATLPEILKNTPALPSHRFGWNKMASVRGISYLDVLTSYRHTRDGVTVLGYRHHGGNTYTVLFEMPDGREVFFHYSEGLFTQGLMKDIFNDAK